MKTGYGSRYAMLTPGVWIDPRLARMTTCAVVSTNSLVGDARSPQCTATIFVRDTTNEKTRKCGVLRQARDSCIDARDIPKYSGNYSCAMWGPSAQSENGVWVQELRSNNRRESIGSVSTKWTQYDTVWNMFRSLHMRRGD